MDNLPYNKIKIKETKEMNFFKKRKNRVVTIVLGSAIVTTSAIGIAAYSSTANRTYRAGDLGYDSSSPNF